VRDESRWPGVAQGTEPSGAAARRTPDVMR
jgi:hypothetical protein